MDKLYTVNEIKEILKISDSTIRRYIKDGKIKTQTLGRQHRITETALKEFLNGQGNTKDKGGQVNE